jgi:CPA2 family monovalent cation:H+ antiporter-2
VLGGTAQTANAPADAGAAFGSFDLRSVGPVGVTRAKVAAFVARDAHRRAPGHSLDPALGRPYRLARAFPPRGARDCARCRLRFAASLFGVSFALGAFFAGMILSESPLSHQAAEESLPLRDAFAVLFFVSVGMLFDPSVIVLRAPLRADRDGR